MSIPITSWLRAFFALQECASDSRGSDELRINEDDVLRWPRTTGSDVIAIAAIFDPSLREAPLRFGGHGVAARWRACVDDLSRFAMASPFEEYAQNRTFWQTLPSVCVYLHAERTPLPPPHIWDALLAQLAEPIDFGVRDHDGVHPEQRNLGPKGKAPFLRVDVKTYEQLFLAQFNLVIELRGFDWLDPTPGMPWILGINEAKIPRTTNRDVIELGHYWNDELARVYRLKNPGGRSNEVIDQVLKAWAETLRQVDDHAPRADANAIYFNNNQFWRALRSIALVVSVFDAAPQIGGPRNVGPKGDGPFKHFDNIKGFHDLWLAQFVYLRDLRGSDKLPAEPGMIGADKVTPRTTNSDVVQLADYWSKQLASVKRIQERDAVEKRWNAALADVDQIARKGDPNAVYPKNNGFWRVLQNTATHISIADEAPSSAALALDALKQAITELPQNLGAGLEQAGRGATSLLGDIGEGLGNTANRIGKGLFSGFGTPLLIGAGLVGLFLIARGDDGKEA